MSPRAFITPAIRAQLLAVARGENPPELAVIGATVADVFAGRWRKANLEVARGWIAYVGPRLPKRGDGTQVVEAEGLYLVPGYVEPHAHPWVLYNPVSLLEAMVPQGVTTLVYDDLVFRTRLGGEGTERVRQAVSATDLPARILWSVRLAPQSRFPEHEENIFAQEALALLASPLSATSGEITRWPRVVEGDPILLEGIAQAQALGLRTEAHGAGASYDRLNALAAAGLEADHEAITSEEVWARLELGFWTMLRWSSLRPDLPRLLKGLEPPFPFRFMLTTDGSAPRFYKEMGFPALLKVVSDRAGPLEALRLATLNPATFLGVDAFLGSVAPGRLADFLLLENPDAFFPLRVYVGGRLVAQEGRLLIPLPRWPLKAPHLTFKVAPLSNPATYSLREAPTLSLVNAVITREAPTPSSRALRAFLLDQEGRWRVGAWVEGLMPELDGMATSFTAAFGLLVLGRDPESMALAAREVARMGGGFAWVREQQVVWSHPLALWGFALEGSFAEAVEVEANLWALARQAGYVHEDILYTLLFLTCDFLPDVRLTPVGVWAVKAGKVLSPPEKL
jgi:adenine deaminase